MVELATLPLKELGLLAVGSLLTSLAYFIKRWIEKKPLADVLERRAKALALHKSLKEQGLSLDDLDELEKDLTRRRRKVRDIEDEVSKELSELRYDGPKPGESQSDMNRLASADTDVANALLERVIIEMAMVCGDEQEPKLRSSQEAWQKYAVAEAKFRSSIFEEGTVYPTMYLSEIERLTVARIADLRAHLAWLKSL